MARRGAPGIITVGNRHEWPREFWGSKDWEDEDRLQAQLGNTSLGASPIVPPPGPQSSFGLFAKPRRARPDARAEAVDRLLEELGVRPRR
jgi:hypothetical protein